VFLLLVLLSLLSLLLQVKVLLLLLLHLLLLLLLLLQVLQVLPRLLLHLLQVLMIREHDLSLQLSVQLKLRSRSGASPAHASRWLLSVAIEDLGDGVQDVANLRAQLRILCKQPRDKRLEAVRHNSLVAAVEGRAPGNGHERAIWKGMAPQRERKKAAS
jgi:hypothetical protein